MKKTARLNSSLLARKGSASPAAAVPLSGFGSLSGPTSVQTTRFGSPDGGPHRIRDVVYDHVDPDPNSPGGLVNRVRQSLNAFRTVDGPTDKPVQSLKAEAMVSHECCKGDPSNKRAAMTLRLDQARHLRLRVLSAHTHRSSQDILTEALDSYLDGFADMPEMQQCECLRSGGKG